MEKLVHCVRGSQYNWSLMSQARRTRHFTQEERESQGVGRGTDRPFSVKYLLGEAKIV